MVSWLFVVLILIVVEDGLVHEVGMADVTNDKGLNPYCSGRWSRTRYIYPYQTKSFMS